MYCWIAESTVPRDRTSAAYPEHMVSRPVPTALSIAGSDSGGGAGIQADLKAFARAGVHGMTAITALTAQNTVGVTGIHPVPGAFIVEQVRAVAEDLGVGAVKIGMLGTAETVAAVREALALLPPGTPVVIDPVMVSESGAVLLDDAARAALVEQLLPLATVITPNLPEARVLAGAGATGAEGEDDAEALARALHALGPDVVVVTGGHRDAAEDVLFDGEEVHRIPGPRHPDGAAHGSGCTHSSILAAHLALGHTPLASARAARRIAGEAVRNGLRGLGEGAGPVDVLSLTHRHPDAPRATDVATPLA
jgi:hydroxymethylpyrimidine/phosphomethylpyrimidine kinase